MIPNQQYNKVTNMLTQKYKKYVPNVFDDSLSLYEQMIALIEHLNQVTNGFNELTDEVSKDINELIGIVNRIEEFALPENVKNVLVSWLSDGTLKDIINNDVFNMKVDKTIYEQFKLSTNQQLAQTNSNVKDLTPVNIRHFGAKSVYEHGYENFDSTQAIQEAIDYALSSDSPSYVYIPNGYYHITDELLINSSIKIEGLYEKGNTGTYVNGSHIHQKTAGKSIFKITGRSYGTEISKMRLSGGKAGIEIVYQTDTDYFSEFVFEKIHFNSGFESAIILNGSIGRISTCDFSANDIGITLEKTSSVWFEHNNFWDAKKHHLVFKGSQTFNHFSNNWFENNGDAGVLIQAPNTMYGVTFTNCEFRTNNRQYVFLIDGNTNPLEQLSIKKLRITRCLLACIGGIDSVIRVEQANNTAQGNNNIVDIQDSVFSYVEEAGISTDFRWLRWNLTNVTQYKQWDTVINDTKVYSPEGVTNIVVSEYNYGENFTTNVGIKLLPHNGVGIEDGQIYRSSNGNIMFRDGTKPRKFILETDKLVERPTPTTWQDLDQNFKNLVSALVESGIIR